MLVSCFLEETAAENPDREALIRDGDRWTYADLDDRASRLRDVLVELGVRRGDRVAIQLGNTPETVAAVFATLKAGAIFTVLSPELSCRTLRTILDNSGAVAVLTGHAAGIECADRAAGVRFILVDDSVASPETPDTAKPLQPLRLLLEGRKAAAPNAPLSSRSDSDICGLIYTSGSTGAPKGVTLSHRNVVAAAGSILQYLEIDRSDTVLNLLPLSSDYGLYNVLMPLRQGARVILDRPFLHPNQIVAPLLHEGVTGLPLTPTIIAILRRHHRLDFPHPEQVRWITSTGQPLPPAHSRWLAATFPAARIFSMYGLTECKRVSYLPPRELEARPTSVGKAIPNTEVYLVAADGSDVRRPGEVGELIVRGPHVMQGYWDQPEATAEVLEVGPSRDDRRLRTGDLFTTDAEGYLYFVGRRDRVIKSGGHIVSPRAVEDVVQELDGVCEAAAIGIAHEVLGNALHLVVVLREGSGITVDTIREHCASQLDRYMVPREIEIRQELPRTLAGKVDYRALAAEAAETVGTGQ